MGMPNAAPNNPVSGVPEWAAAEMFRGESVMSAALCALTEENSSGWAKAKRSAPYPPMEMPLMARAERSRRIE